MINHKGLRLTKLALALSIALAASVPAMAQNTTSAIGGRISSNDGKPAAGAKVTIVHNESGSVSNVTADAEGRYTARGLRVGGPYTITITKDGVSEKREGIYLQLAETANVDAQLGMPMQTVIIGGQAGGSKFNSSSMGAGTNIGRAELSALGSVQRSLADYARMDPRLGQTDKDRGEISAGGQNSRYNSITVDGVSISDSFGLELNGLPTNKQPISIDAIQSVQVNISNYDVTQKGYTGANINAVTKSGTNDWKGSVYYLMRDDNLVGKRYNRATDTYTDFAPFKENTKGITLGGPLIKDKLFIFVSAEDAASSRTTPAFGPLGGPLNNVAITQSAIAGLQSIAKNKYGFDAGGTDVPDGVELTVKDRLVKLDWNINDDHRANLRWQKTVQSEPSFFGFGATSIALSSYYFAEEKTVESGLVQLFSDWTPTFSTEFKLSRRDSGKRNANNSFLPSINLAFPGTLPPEAAGTSVATGTRRINLGNEFSRQFNELRTKTDDLYAGATWLMGNHEIKGGADVQRNEMFNAFIANANGAYSFGCTNSSATFTYTFGSVNCSTSPSSVIEAAVLENFSRGRPLNYIAVLPVPGLTRDDAAARWTLESRGLFLQDTWKVTPRLNVTYGLRYDSAHTNDRPAKNNAVAQPRVAGAYSATSTLIVRDTGGLGVDNTVTIDGDSLIQPRFGFNYRLDAVRPTQLRGGVGLFRGAGANVWLGNPFGSNGVALYNVGCGNTFAACGSTENIFSADPLAQKPIAGVVPAAVVDVLAPGIAQPSVYKANFGVEHELPWAGMVLSAEYLYTKTNEALFYRNLNLGAATRTGPDGRPMFWTETGYTATCANGSGGFTSSGACAGFRSKALSNAAFGNVMQLLNTQKGGGQLMTVSVSSGRSKDLKWSLAYTYSEAREVSGMTNSQAASSWSARAAFDPNEEVSSNANGLIRDRINGSLMWEHRFFGQYKTSFGAFYEGRVGKPYSWTFNNDMNGDAISSNDLMYIPKAFGSGEVIFRGDTATSKVNEQKFWNAVNGNPELLRAAGGVMRRNDSYAPWTNSIDLRISQEVPGLFKGNKGVFVLDIANFGNLLNKRWGRINEVGLATQGGVARSFVDYAGMQDGKYVYQVRDTEDYNIKQFRNESQWVIQATARYEF